jgi:hypothetical protein
VPVFSVEKISLRLRALGESGLNREARAVAQAVLAVLCCPYQPPAGVFDSVDFSKLPPGWLEIELLGALPWRRQ